MAGVVHIPWYATGLRADKLAAALADISAIALRYGARSHALYRYRDDRYKFLQVAEFEDKVDFDLYWSGPEFTDFRVICSGWFQVPVVYGSERTVDLQLSPVDASTIRVSQYPFDEPSFSIAVMTRQMVPCVGQPDEVAKAGYHRAARRPLVWTITSG